MTADSLPGVGELIGAMTRRAGPLVEDRDWSTIDEWASFSARFLLVESDGDRVLIKLGTNWAPGQSVFVADEIDRVSRLVATLDGFSVTMPGVLGVLSDPPAIAMPHVRGPLLFDKVADLDVVESSRLVEACGAVLGSFHAAQVADDDRGREPALEELLGAARRAGRSRQSALDVEPRLVRARGYRFSPNDFLLGEDGQLVLLDPPHVNKYDYVHRDLGSFTMELHRAIVGDRPPGQDSDTARLDRLVEGLFGSYATRGPVDPRQPLDRWAVRLFETARISGVARGRLRTVKIAPFVRATRWAMWSRRKLGELQSAPNPTDTE